MQSIQRWAEARPLPTRLHWAAEFFRVTGYLIFIGVGITAATIFAGFASLLIQYRASPAAFAGQLVLGLASGIGSLFTGRALRSGRRVGGWRALGTLLPALAASLTNVHAYLPVVLVTALGSVAVLTSWRELE